MRTAHAARAPGLVQVAPVVLPLLHLDAVLGGAVGVVDGPARLEVDEVEAAWFGRLVHPPLLGAAAQRGALYQRGSIAAGAAADPDGLAAGDVDDAHDDAGPGRHRTGRGRRGSAIRRRGWCRGGRARRRHDRPGRGRASGRGRGRGRCHRATARDGDEQRVVDRTAIDDVRRAVRVDRQRWPKGVVSGGEQGP